MEKSFVKTRHHVAKDGKIYKMTQQVDFILGVGYLYGPEEYFVNDQVVAYWDIDFRKAEEKITVVPLSPQ